MPFDIEKSGASVASPFSPFFKNRRAVESGVDAHKEQVERLMRSTCMITTWKVNGVAEYPDWRAVRSELTPFAGGSGSIVGIDGRTVTVLTNAHVLQNAHSVSLTLEQSVRGEPIGDVQVAYVDPATDLALLTFEMPEGVEPPPSVECGDSGTLKKYDEVDVIGSPILLDVAMPHPARIVALPGEPTKWDGDIKSRFINTIKVGGEGTGPGSSGSAVFADGKMVGLWFGSITDSASATRIGCFIPVAEIKTVLEHPKIFGRAQKVLNDVFAERLGTEDGIGLETSFKKMVAGVQDEFGAEAARVGTTVEVLAKKVIEQDGTQAIRRMFRELVAFSTNPQKYNEFFRQSFYGIELYPPEKP